ncbi:MAG: F0F1 ATP synthase subunit gamma [Mycoplasmataceae bacterium]|nr:F0F1 ATP synthase subunit gamma [Mycoplasmataceae bacterium]
MKNLLNIKRQINLVREIKKISRTNLQVQSIKRKKNINFLETINTYYVQFYATMHKIINSLELENKKNIFFNNKNNKTLWVIIGLKDKMNGSFKNMFLKKINNEIKENDEIITISTKMHELLKKQTFSKNVIENFDFKINELQHFQVLPISTYIINYFQNNKYPNIKIIYAHQLTRLNYEIRIKKILPIDESTFGLENSKNISNNLNNGKIIIFEPNSEKIFLNAIPLFISIVLQLSILETQICGQTNLIEYSRAIENNCDKMNDYLTLEYNVIRQEKITNEIFEIINGGN